MDQTNAGLQISRRVFWLILADKAALSAPFFFFPELALTLFEIILFYKLDVNSTCLWKVTPAPPLPLVLSRRKH